MITPLQQCRIYVVIDGISFEQGRSLELPTIQPLSGYEKPRILTIPANLKDPITTQNLSTTEHSALPVGELQIHTSDKNMRFGRGGKRQWRHTVTYHTKKSGIIGKIPMSALDVDSSHRDYLYCECYLEALDKFQQNNRGPLSESPLTRAVESWISAQVRAICRELEDRERRQLREQDKNELSRLNDFLDHWKNQFLQGFMQGLYGQGGGIEPPPPPPLPVGVPAQIEVALTNPRAGKGVYFKPTIKFFDAQNRRIRPVSFHWASEDNNIAIVDEDLMLVQTFSFGTTKIYAETADGKIRSNVVPLEVVRILDIRIAPHEIEMEAGSRRKLEAICKLFDGSEVSNVYLTWLENNSSVVRVSSSGLVYAFSPGKTEVIATDDSCRSETPALLTVIPASGEGKGQGKNRGKGPRILISEVDTGPNEDHPAVLKSDEPPVYQRVQDIETNVWWINLASPFARFYYTNYGTKSEAWRMYHVERVIDIIVQIALSHGPDSEDSRISRDWIQQSAAIEAEIRQGALESLKDFIENGETIA